MVSYLQSRENLCNGQSHAPCHRIVQNDEEGSEIEFEGWIQMGNPVRERTRGCVGSCQRSCSVNSPNMHVLQNDNNCCSNNDVINVLWEHAPKNSCNHLCPHNLNVYNSVRRVARCPDCNGKVNVFEKQIRNENEIYYVNNRQNPPSVVVQKPQTVVVRNRSRPPIIVQQPPPNVIVKNDPPQPIYVQNPPPNITVKNTAPERGINEESFIRQSACGMNRSIQNVPIPPKRNHCIYHCKHPCCNRIQSLNLRGSGNEQVLEIQKFQGLNCFSEDKADQLRELRPDCGFKMLLTYLFKISIRRKLFQVP